MVSALNFSQLDGSFHLQRVGDVEVILSCNFLCFVRCATTLRTTALITQHLSGPKYKSNFQNCPEVWRCFFRNSTGVRLPFCTKIQLTTLQSRMELSSNLKMKESMFGCKDHSSHSGTILNFAHSHLFASIYTPYSKMAANKLFFCLHVN